MPEEKTDVNKPAESSTVEETAVNNTAESAQQESSTETVSESTTTQPETEAGKSSVEALDENGVPYKNRFFEYKRKNEELADRLPTMIQEAINQSMGNAQQAQPKYTIDQLELFAEQSDNPSHKQWAKSEIRKIEEEKTASLIRSEFEKINKNQKDETTKINANRYVSDTYPEAFLKDTSGKPIGWNENHPLTRMIAQLMNNPDLKNRPDGIAIASDIAYGRYVKLQGSNSQQKNIQLQREVRNLQKKTLVEGGGREASQVVPAHSVAIDKLKQSGSIRDAQNAIREILKARKASEE